MSETLTAEEQQLMAAQREGDEAPWPDEPEGGAAPPATERTGEPQEQPADDGAEDDKPRTGTVPHQKYHEEREKRKEAAAERDRLKADYEAAQGQNRQLMEFMQRFAPQQQQPAQQQPAGPAPIPNFNENFNGWLQGVTEQAEAFRTYQRQQAQQQQVQQAESQLTQIAIQHERDFAARTPDYTEATTYLRTSRDNELKAAGYSDVQRAQMLRTDLMSAAAMAVQRGVNVAEQLYAMSAARGYRKAEPQAAAPNESERLERIAAGQRQSGALAGAGSATPQRITPDQAGALSEGEWGKLSDAARERILAGG